MAVNIIELLKVIEPRNSIALFQPVVSVQLIALCTRPTKCLRKPPEIWEFNISLFKQSELPI
jgi:hypothetical protein